MVDVANIHIDYGKEKKYYHIKAARLAVSYCKKDYAKVLDYGCGVGHTLAEMQEARPDFKLYAADAYEKCIEITGSRVNLSGFYKVEDDMTVNTLDDKYDIIILSHVIEHTRDPLDSIDRCRDMLKSGGILVVVAPNILNLRTFLASIFYTPKTNEGHIVAWDSGHWRNLLRLCQGMELLEVANDELCFFSRSLSVLSFWKKVEIGLSKIFPRFSFSHIAVLRKENL